MGDRLSDASGQQDQAPECRPETQPCPACKVACSALKGRLPPPSCRRACRKPWASIPTARESSWPTWPGSGSYTESSGAMSSTADQRDHWDHWNRFRFMKTGAKALPSCQDDTTMSSPSNARDVFGNRRRVAVARVSSLSPPGRSGAGGLSSSLSSASTRERRSAPPSCSRACSTWDARTARSLRDKPARRGVAVLHDKLTSLSVSIPDRDTERQPLPHMLATFKDGDTETRRSPS